MDADDQKDSEPTIEGYLQEAEKDIKNLKECDAEESEEIIGNIESNQKEAKEELQAYEANIELLEHREAKPFRETQKKYQATLEDLYEEFKRAREHTTEEVIPAQAQAIRGMSDGQVLKEATKIGDAIQRDNLKTAKNILGMINDSQEVVKDINKEIKEQYAKLLECEDIIKDSQSALARAAKLVDYFDTAFAKDIFLKIMLGTIALAIIGVIVFACISKGDSKKEAQKTAAADQIKNQTGAVNCATADLSPGIASATNDGNVNCLEFSSTLDSVESNDAKPGMEVYDGEPAPKRRLIFVADSRNQDSKQRRILASTKKMD